ncbi:hypothetical protein CXB51_009116 [Gossypium anomalum]|uniref:Integrase catalytic domain-containing protein n=1 Tax=Gossypium anomalum TaxID=47600 RepID=A0A8J6D617_9ROSI|nr:hypothetical protein CXB51_009116 [Gossypium anomalum]
MAAGLFLMGLSVQERKDQMLLRCVDDVEAKKILEEVHEGICGTHAMVFNMARKIMRLGYYWLTMESDCINFAENVTNAKSTAIKFMANLSKGKTDIDSSLWSSITHKMDRSRFICQCDKDYSCRFFKKEIICRYGLPERIISDNATNLNHKMMKEVCERSKLKHHNLLLIAQR